MACSECRAYGGSCPCCEEEIDNECPKCGSEMDIVDSGRYKGIPWDNLKCSRCGEEVNDEPDWDSIFDNRYDR